jgi:membrane-associated phospholipid phosphatase
VHSKSQLLGARSLVLACAVGATVLAFVLDDWASENLSRPIRSGLLNAALFAMRFWGESVTLLAVTSAAVLLHPDHWKKPAAILVATFICSAAVDLAKPFAARRRPEETLPEASSASWGRPANRGRNSSFPSGHTATAFAFARGLSLAYPPLKPLCLALATGTGLSRIHELRHYLSDCVVGALAGWFGAGAVWRLIFRLESRGMNLSRRQAPELRLAG